MDTESIVLTFFCSRSVFSGQEVRRGRSVDSLWDAVKKVCLIQLSAFLIEWIKGGGQK